MRGRSRPYRSLREGSKQAPTGALTEGKRAYEMEAIHSSHPFCFLLGLGYALWSFVRRPFPMLGRESVARSRGLPHPQLLRVGDALVLRFAFRCRHARGPHAHVGLEGLAGGARARLRHLRRASNVAAQSETKGPGHRDRRGPSPGRGAGDFQSLLAHHPGAGVVHWRGDLWGRRVREDFGLHAPVRPAASGLASEESTECGRRRSCSKSREISATTSAES